MTYPLFIKCMSLMCFQTATPTTDTFSVPEGDLPVFAGSTITRGVFFTLILTFVLRHGLNQVAAGDLISVLNLVKPGCIPQSKYMFNKLARISCKADTHTYCGDCNGYVCKFGSDCVATVCPECNTSVDCKAMVKSGNFFLGSLLGEQLRNVFENTEIPQLVQQKHSLDATRSTTDYTDITSGSQHKTMTGHYTNNLELITLSFNIDGVPIFNSSTSSLWPVFHTINELPAQNRREHMILQCLWYGRGKPRMDTYLKPLVTEMKNLNDVGFVWNYQNSCKVPKVRLGLCASDSVARPVLQNFKQFNGSHGCGFCLHEGQPKGEGTARVYPIQEKHALLEQRTHQQTIVHANEAVNSHQPVLEVKGPSILFLIRFFNIISCFNPEYMHSCLLGTARQFGSLWFDTSSHRKPYYLGRKQSDIDHSLLSIKPPAEFIRIP